MSACDRILFWSYETSAYKWVFLPAMRNKKKYTAAVYATNIMTRLIYGIERMFRICDYNVLRISLTTMVWL